MKTTILRQKPWSAAVVAALVVLPVTHRTVSAGLPESGVPVASLSAYDDAMQNFMATYAIEAGVLAVSRNGCIVYQRGFGLLGARGPNTPENTPMRIASVEKPLTSAAIRRLVAAGTIDWTDFVFNLGQAGGGLLPHVPWNGVGDNRLDNITVQNVFNHQGGWDRDTAPIRDPQFRSVQIANEMGVAHPAGRDNTIRYMLSEPLEFTPGTNGCRDDNGNAIFCYSNFGYMVLGRVIEQVTGVSHLTYVRQNVLTPAMWVPSTEIFLGRTFAANQSPREPSYDCDGCTCTNVYNPAGGTVGCPYGGWNHESFVGHGNLAVSAAPLLVYMDNYQVGVGGMAGTPITGTGNGSVHTGAIDGTSTVMWQRGDGTNIVVLFNKRSGSVDFAFEMGQTISDLVDDGLSWPSFCVDGFWVDFGTAAAFEVGGYNAPFRSMNTALANTTNGTKLRFKPGTSNWTGTINERMLLDAPFGLARIGVQ